MTQLLRPKRFNLVYALLWFSLFGIGLLIYLGYYAGKRESVVYIEADERGTTKTRKALVKGASEPLKRHPGCSEKA